MTTREQSDKRGERKSRWGKYASNSQLWAGVCMQVHARDTTADLYRKIVKTCIIRPCKIIKKL